LSPPAEFSGDRPASFRWNKAAGPVRITGFRAKDLTAKVPVPYAEYRPEKSVAAGSGWQKSRFLRLEEGAGAGA